MNTHGFTLREREREDRTNKKSMLSAWRENTKIQRRIARRNELRKVI